MTTNIHNKPHPIKLPIGTRQAPGSTDGMIKIAAARTLSEVHTAAISVAESIMTRQL